MKKQYRKEEVSFLRFILYVYHNGQLVWQEKMWLDKFEEAEEKLEAEGYTYCYTKEEVEEQRQRYEFMLNNQICDGGEI